MCLNQDNDGDGVPDLLDYYDPTLFSADTTCPFDPTSPPVQSHSISGAISIASAVALDLSNFNVVTTDGPGNCQVALADEAFGKYSLAYKCTVYDWGSGWTGAVVLKPNSNLLYCPQQYSAFVDLTSDASQDFSCRGGPTITIEGPITDLTRAGAAITSMAIVDSVSGTRGLCEFVATQYRCVAPYDGVMWSGTLAVGSAGYVCGTTENVFAFDRLTVDGSPYNLNIVVVDRAGSCPAELTLY